MKFGKLFKRAVIASAVLFCAFAIIHDEAKSSDEPTAHQLHIRAQCAAQAMQYDTSWQVMFYWKCMKDELGIDKPWTVPWIGTPSPSNATTANPTSLPAVDQR